ncbi:MAG: FHA domain-containing protein [Planctomycetota bacterium]|jgi:pSer/pThr/pTyr-binding forkhead associated (FHA) protein
MEEAPSLHIRVGERSKRYQILDPEITIGPGEDDDLRLKSKGMVPGQLTISQQEDGYLIYNSADSKFKLWINGRQVEDHLLVDGDIIEVGKMRVEFSWEGAVREERISTTASRNKRIAKARRARHERQASGPNLKLITIVSLGALAIGIPSVIWLQKAEFGMTPPEMIEFAENQLELGKFAEAEAYLARAERAEPSAEELMAIERVRKKVAAVSTRSEDLPVLNRATRAFSLLQRFESQYLLEDPDRREACREMLREIAEWRANYQEVCNRHRSEPQYLDILNKTQDWENKYRSAAELSDPDNETDVLFAAGRKVRLRLRRYALAVALLESWLEKNVESGSRKGAEVRDRINEYHGDCIGWVSDKIIESNALAERGHVDEAISMMETIVEECALPGSLSSAKAQLADLKRRR